MAQAAALIGALGAVLVLVTPRRGTVLLGLAAIAAAVGLFHAAGGTAISPAKASLGLVGILVLAAGAVLFVRLPELVPLLVLAAAPFRLPLDIGSQHRFYVGIAQGGQIGRLLPLYAVLAAAVMACVWQLARGRAVRPLPREIAVPLAALVAFGSLSYLWTDVTGPATNLLEFFTLPFVVLVFVVSQSPFPTWMPRMLGVVTVSLAALFAAVGLIERGARDLIFYTPAVQVGNAYSGFFRVTSLFRDPSLYGRYVVLGLAVVLAVAWYRRIRLAIAVGLVVFLFAGLFFSYSQSSLAALFAVALLVGIVAGDRPVRLGAVIITVFVIAAGGALVANKAASAGTQRATSDRSRRIQLTAKVIAHHPLVGVGIGSQPHASQAESKDGGPAGLFVSHTTPLTVLAELGIIGFALYLALLGGTTRALARVWRIDRVFGLALGGVFLALFVHSCFYSGFFEDPITWLVLGITASFLSARAAT